MGIFGRLHVHEDPDEGESIFIVSSEETIMYASLSDAKALDMADVLDAAFDYEEGFLTVYEVPLDVFLLESDQLDYLMESLDDDDE
jgi:hypothetical protein